MRGDGFSIIEVLLAISIFSLIVMSLVTGLVYGQLSTAASGSHGRAVLLAEEGLEAARNIRDSGYANLTTGAHGLAISANTWIFSGASDTTDGFTRVVTVNACNGNCNNNSPETLTSTVSWSKGVYDQGTVTLTSELANWKPF